MRGIVSKCRIERGFVKKARAVANSTHIAEPATMQLNELKEPLTTTTVA